MIKTINFLGKPTKNKLNQFILLGALFISLGIIDTILNSFYEIRL